MTHHTPISLSRRSFIGGVAASVPLAALLAACGSDDPSATTEATGTLNFLNFTGWAGPTTYTDFAAANTGSSVNEIAWVSADDAVTKAKDRAGDIDLLLVDGTTFPRLAAIGALADLGDVANLSAVSAPYLGNDWDPTNARFAPTDHGRTGLIYRRDLVDTAPTSWADFVAMAPDYAGRVAVLDYNRSVMGNLLRMLGRPSSTTEQADLDAVLDVLITLKPSLLAIATEVGSTVASGDAVMAMVDAYDAQQAVLANPDVVWVDPSEGQVGYLEGLAILDGPRNELASRFVDFFLEPSNYAAFVNNVATPYVQSDNDAIDEALRASAILNPPADVVERLEYHAFLGESQGIWDTAWDAFKAS